MRTLTFDEITLVAGGAVNQEQCSSDDITLHIEAGVSTDGAHVTIGADGTICQFRDLAANTSEGIGNLWNELETWVDDQWDDAGSWIRQHVANLDAFYDQLSYRWGQAALEYNYWLTINQGYCP